MKDYLGPNYELLAKRDEIVYSLEQDGAMQIAPDAMNALKHYLKREIVFERLYRLNSATMMGMCVAVGLNCLSDSPDKIHNGTMMLTGQVGLMIMGMFWGSRAAIASARAKRVEELIREKLNEHKNNAAQQNQR